jgi:peptide/nickel transport system permease protein
VYEVVEMTNLATYVVWRLLLFVFVLFGVTIVVFAITMMLPMDTRALLYVTGRIGIPDAIQNIIQKYGLKDPFYLQYWHWLFRLLHGNLGWSITANQPVATSIAARWPYTFEIVLFAAPLIIFAGIYLGVQSAIHENGLIGKGSRLLSIIGWSLPSFFLGMLLLAVFAGILHWFPYGGSLSISWVKYTSDPQNHFIRYTRIDLFDGLLNGVPALSLNVLWHCVLPVATVVVIDVALLIRVVRSSMLETLSKPYLTMARAKGLSDKVVIYKHARRNALIPILSLSGMLVAGLLIGLIITETVFGFGGLGEQLARAIRNLDIPFIMGFTVLSAFVIVLANFIADITSACIDPRIRRGSERERRRL